MSKEQDPCTKNLVAILLLTLAFSASAQWKYSASKDEMTDEVTKFATLESPTKLNLAFPYAGGTGARLVITLPQHVVFEPRLAKDSKGYTSRVRLVVNRGQLLDSEGMTFRFDDGAPVHFSTVGAADGSTQFLSVVSPEAMILRDGAWWLDTSLVARIDAAKRVRVQVTFYREGQRVFEFNPAGLKLDRPKAPPVVVPTASELADRDAKRQAEKVAEAERLELQRLEAVRQEAATAKLTVIRSLVPSLLPYATGAVLLSSAEAASDGSHPSNGVLGVACRDGRKLAVVVGTGFKTKRAFGSFGAALTLVRFYFDDDSTLRNWAQVSSSESAPLTSQNEFVLRMTTSKVLKVALEREGFEDRQAVTFALDQAPLRAELETLATSCK